MAAIAAGELALQAHIPGQKAFRLKDVRQILQGPSPYSQHQDIPAQFQTPNFDLSLVDQLFSQSGSVDARPGKILALYDDQTGQVESSDLHLSTCQQMHQHQQHQSVSQKQRAGQQHNGFQLPDAADLGLAYVQRFHGFANNGQLLVHSLVYRPGDVLQAACIEQYSEVTFLPHHQIGKYYQRTSKVHARVPKDLKACATRLAQPCGSLSGVDPLPHNEQVIWPSCTQRVILHPCSAWPVISL